MKNWLGIILFVVCFENSKAQEPTFVLPTEISVQSLQPYLNFNSYDTVWAYVSNRSVNGLPPLHLVNKQISFNSKPWEYPPPWPPYEPWPPYPYPIFDLGAIGVYFLVDTNFCEDKFHDNGKLSKDVTCVNGKLHGKTYYYDETGHKTHEETYHEGKLIKAKYYDNYGRMTSTTHYDFSGRRHGQHIVVSFEFHTKSITNYKHGVEHGEFKVYERDVLQIRKVYDNGNLVLEQEYAPSGKLIFESIWYNHIQLEYKHFGENGQLAIHQKKDSTDHFIFYKQWDRDGVLIKENLYENGQPHGKWLSYHDVARQQKNHEIYNYGKKIKNETFINEQCIAYTLFENEKPVLQVAFFENGDTSMLVNYDADGSYRQRTWHEKNHQELYSDVSFKQDLKTGLRLRDEGFYHDGDTLIRYQIEDENWNMICIHYVIYNNDTVRIDYVRNYSSLNQRTEVFWSNRYVKLQNNEWVKNGVWANYQSNNLVCYQTFELGVLNGRSSEYKSQNDSVYLVQSGYYLNGLRHGSWVTQNDSIQIMANYLEGKLNGEQFICNQESVIIENSFYLDDKLHGYFFQYYNQHYPLIKLSGMYEEGLKSGTWQWYDEFGRIVLVGNYKNGEPVGKWIEYTYDEKGNQISNRLNKSEYLELNQSDEIML